MLFVPLLLFWLLYWPLSLVRTENRWQELFQPRTPYQTVFSRLIRNMLLTLLAACLHDCFYHNMRIINVDMSPISDHQLINLIVALISFFVKLLLTGLITEVWFYSSHRLMHTTLLYKYHKAHHIFTRPKAIASVYCSGLEMLLVNYMSVVLGPSLVGMHEWEIVIWAIIVCWDVIAGHSGQPGQWSGGTDHEIHHTKFNYNYGTLTLMDRLFNTYYNNQSTVHVSQEPNNIV